MNLLAPPRLSGLFMGYTALWLRAVLLLLILVAIGLATHSDITRRRVSNLLILVMIGLGAAVQTIDIRIGLRPVLDSLALFGFALILGFGLYLMQFWAAGDGKYFLALSMVLPVQAASFVNLPLNLLAWASGLQFIFLLVFCARPITRELTVRTAETYREMRTWGRLDWVKQALSLGELLVQIISFMGISRLWQFFLPKVQGPVVMLFLAIALRWVLQQVQSRYRMLAQIPLIGLGLYALTNSAPRQWALLAVMIPLAQFARAVTLLADNAMSRRVSLTQLQSGSFLREAVILDSQGQLSVATLPELEQLREQAEQLKELASPQDGALVPDQVMLIQQYAGQSPDGAAMTVEVSWTLPFLPFLTAGAVAVVILALAAAR